MTGYAAICLLGLALSLWLALRQRATAFRRLSGALLQSAIWLLVWTLANPPALLPAEPAATLEISSTTVREKQISPEEIAAAQAVRMTGDGLPRDALRDLPPVRLQPEDPSSSPGWQLDWPREVTLGEPLQLQITLHGGHQQPLQLTLEDPFGTEVGSAQLGREDKQIALKAWPKLAGNWLYRVRITEQTDGHSVDQAAVSEQPVIRTEMLPVIVREPQSPRVLLWFSRPGFESAALARWLRQSATPTQVVTQLAPEIQRRETFNGQSLQKTNLLAADSPFDLLVLDSRLWPQLNASQRQQIATLAQSKSLLWLVDIDSPQGFLAYARDQGMPLAKHKASAITYSEDVSSGQIPELQLSGYHPSEIQAGDNKITANQQTIYWSRVQPHQSLGFAFFGNSYRWKTSGFAREFALLWKQLFDHQLAWHDANAPVHASTPLPRAQQRLTLCSNGFDDIPPALHAQEHTENAKSLPGIAAGISEYGRCHSYWPQHAGWYRLGAGAIEYSLYIFGKHAWGEWQTAIARNDTAQMASTRLGPKVTAKAARQPLPLYWIALALLALLTVTWSRERHSLR